MEAIPREILIARLHDAMHARRMRRTAHASMRVSYASGADYAMLVKEKRQEIERLKRYSEAMGGPSTLFSGRATISG